MSSRRNMEEADGSCWAAYKGGAEKGVLLLGGMLAGGSQRMGVFLSGFSYMGWTGSPIDWTGGERDIMGGVYKARSDFQLLFLTFPIQ